MNKGCVLKGIAFLAGTILISSIAPSGVLAEQYVSKHGGHHRHSDHYYSSSNNNREPWIDIDIVKPEPVRIEHRTTVINHYYDDDDDDDYRHEHRRYWHHKKHHYKHHINCCLPPGWHTRIRPGCVMPSNIYVYREPVPQYVIVNMPPQPPGVVHIMVGGKVVRLMEATRTIMDVFDI